MAPAYPPGAHLTRNETWTLFGLSFAALALIAQTFHGDGAPITASLAFSVLAFTGTYALVRWLGPTFIKAGLKGRDIGKKGRPVIPESMGAVCATVYLLIVIVFIPFPFYKDIVAATSGGGNRDVMEQTQEQVAAGRYLHRFPHSKLASYLSAILSLQSIVILGIGDDIMDIKWRHKVFIPVFASIPLLIVYFCDFGVTQVVIPRALQPYLGELFDLGWLYYAYMSAICIFSPHSINILAGINGLEVGQSIVVACLILLNDALYILPLPFSQNCRLTHTPALDPHYFSVYLLLPFVGASAALFAHNAYPARVFVGDTYCYFAGMVFAVVAILAHFSKTLLLLLVPQIINFLYSAPQLFGIIPCPRHRLPHLNARTGLLEPSWADWSPPLDALLREADEDEGRASGNETEDHQSNGHGQRQATHARTQSLTKSARQPSPSPSRMPTPSSNTLAQHRPVPRFHALPRLTQSILHLLHTLRLLKIETDPTSGNVVRCTNMTLLNLWLVWRGPMREDKLAQELLGLATGLGLAGLGLRHAGGRWAFGRDVC